MVEIILSLYLIFIKSFMKIILASKSPRRSQLLKEIGYSFTIRTKETDESYPEDMPVREVALFLARKKAHDCAEFIQNKDEILLTADTTVVWNDKIYGKPENRADAIRILSDLSGQMHEVVTGVCLYSLSQEVCFAETACVYFAPLSPDEITNYIDSYQPYDKAGAYAIQEWIGLAKIRKIEGSYSTIMGLPTARLYDELQKISSLNAFI